MRVTLNVRVKSEVGVGAAIAKRAFSDTWAICVRKRVA